MIDRLLEWGKETASCRLHDPCQQASLKGWNCPWNCDWNFELLETFLPMTPANKDCAVVDKVEPHGGDQHNPEWKTARVVFHSRGP